MTPDQTQAGRDAAVARLATANALIDAKVADLDTLITALAGGGAAWDNLSPAARTLSVRGLAQDLKALALDHKRIMAELLDAP